MPGQTVIIGCRLPHGLLISHPNPEIKEKVKLNGYFSNKLFNSNGSPAMTYGTTEVDADFWALWSKAYTGYKPLVTGALFVARSEQDAKAKAREYSDERTGFEPIDPNSLGVKTAK